MSVRQRTWTGNDGKEKTAWVVDIELELPNGKTERIRKTSPVNTRRGAEDFERQLRNELLAGTYGKAKQVPTLREFREAVLAEASQNNAPSSVENKRGTLDLHLIPVLGKLRMNELDTQQIDRFTTAKLAEGLDRSTINKHLAVLSRALSLAEEYAFIDKLPKIKRLKKLDEDKVLFLEFDEADRVVEHASETFRTMILFALRTGLRIGELIALRWEDIDFAAGWITVRRSIWGTQEKLPKSGKIRRVPILGKARAALLEHPRRSEYVFASNRGRLAKSSITSVPKETARRAGVAKEIGWHSLRHTFASHLVMRGTSLRVVQELLGHSKIDQTLRYAHLTPDSLMVAVGGLDDAPPKRVGILADETASQDVATVSEADGASGDDFEDADGASEGEADGASGDDSEEPGEPDGARVGEADGASASEADGASAGEADDASAGEADGASGKRSGKARKARASAGEADGASGKRSGKARKAASGASANGEEANGASEGDPDGASGNGAEASGASEGEPDGASGNGAEEASGASEGEPDGASDNGAEEASGASEGEPDRSRQAGRAGAKLTRRALFANMPPSPQLALRERDTRKGRPAQRRRNGT